MHGTKEYNAFKAMHDRCKRKHWYKNIKICKRWNKFENFFKDMGSKPTPKHSLDRINNNGNYSPSNCRWGSVEQQQNNKRNNVFIIFKGEKHSLKEWSIIKKIDLKTLRNRRSNGWSTERMLGAS
jgi:hypothetical protein